MRKRLWLAPKPLTAHYCYNRYYRFYIRAWVKGSKSALQTHFLSFTPEASYRPFGAVGRLIGSQSASKRGNHLGKSGGVRPHPQIGKGADICKRTATTSPRMKGCNPKGYPESMATNKPYSIIGNRIQFLKVDRPQIIFKVSADICKCTATTSPRQKGGNPKGYSESMATKSRVGTSGNHLPLQNQVRPTSPNQQRCDHQPF